MPKSSKRPSAAKVGKPYPGFPLFPHATRRWAKKIRQRLVYFGPVTADGDHGAQAALDEYQRQAADLHAGRTPRPKIDGLRLDELCDRLLNAKRARLDGGKLSARSFASYYRTCKQLIEFFGAARPIEGFDSADFEALYAHVAKTLGPASQASFWGWTRAIFRYGMRVTKKPIDFGEAFQDAKGAKRGARPAGERMFAASEIKAMLDAARPDVKAWILLAVNAGFGNNDLATLPLAALDLNAGWAQHARPKTGAERRCPLWPETAEALRVAIARRPAPAAPEYDGLVFLTARGTPLIHPGPNGRSWTDTVTDTADRFLKRLGLKKPGRCFYALRHVCRTIADETCDFPAINYVLGHLDVSTGGRYYREGIADARLLKVTEHVRAWLFAPDPAAGDDQEPATIPFRSKVG